MLITNKKKLNLNIFWFLIVILLLWACNGDQDQNELDELSLDEVLEKGEKLNNEITRAEKKLSIRKQKGDTLAIDYKKLIEIFPEIKGFQKQPTEGTNIDDNGDQYSNAIQNYKSKDAELEISIFDYNNAINLFAAASSWKTMNEKVEDNEGYRFVEKLNNYPDSWIYVEYNKIEKNAVVTAAINDRFVLSINATNQESPNFVRKIAEEILNNNKQLFDK